jgi:hypothetical protein
MPENYYDIGWLEVATKNCKNNLVKNELIDGSISIHDFIKRWAYQELNNIYTE